MHEVSWRKSFFEIICMSTQICHARVQALPCVSNTMSWTAPEAKQDRFVILPEFFHVSHTFAKYSFLPSKFLDLQLKQPDVFYSLPILHFPLIQNWLLDFNLLVQKSQFIIAANQLAPQDVSLTNNLEMRHAKAKFWRWNESMLTVNHKAFRSCIFITKKQNLEKLYFISRFF